MESFNPLKRQKKKSTIYWDNPRSLEPGATLSDSASLQAPNYVQCS